MERKWTDIQYHFQNNAAVEIKYVKMYCKKNHFQELSYSGTHSKPHGSRGLSKHYHLRFDPKLGMGKCAICHIPCAYVIISKKSTAKTVPLIKEGQKISWKENVQKESIMFMIMLLLHINM